MSSREICSRDTFLSFVVDLFSTQADRHYKRSDLSKSFAKSGRRFVHHPLMGLNTDFTEETSPQWVHDYFKKTKNRIFLPKTPRSLKSAQLIIDPVSPKQLRSWFKNLYG